MIVVGFNFFGGSSTTAGDYSTAEVKEIIDILKRDDETRHGLLIPNSSMNDEQISLDLWEAVLGKPDAVVKSKGNGEDWTYRTKDGTASIPVILSNEMGKPDVGVPWLFAADPQFSTGLGDKGADRESLKRHILAMKRRVDKTLPENPYEGMSPKEIRALVAKETEEKHRRESERLDQEEAERQAQRDEQFNEDAVAESIRRKADADFHDHVREYFRFGSRERTVLSDQATEWIEGRREALTAASKANRDWRQLSLPDKDTVLAAITNGKAVPVVGENTTQDDELQTQQIEDVAAAGPQEGETAKGPSVGPAGQDTKKETPSRVSASAAGGASHSPTPKVTAPKTGVEVKSIQQQIAELTEEALNKKVSLTNPYPESYADAPGDRISVQYAVIELTKQAGLQYDFDRSLKNTDPLSRNWVEPDIQNKTFQEALEAILKPLGLTYAINQGVIVLERQPATDTAKTPSTDPEPTKTPPAKTVPKQPAAKTIAEQTKEALGKRVSLTQPYPESYKGAPRDKLSVQYAVMEIAEQAGLRYDFETSQKNTDPVCRRWVRPDVKNLTCREALEAILRPVGLKHRINDGVIVLERR